MTGKTQCDTSRKLRLASIQNLHTVFCILHAHVCLCVCVRAHVEKTNWCYQQCLDSQTMVSSCLWHHWILKCSSFWRLFFIWDMIYITTWKHVAPLLNSYFQPSFGKAIWCNRFLHIRRCLHFSNINPALDNGDLNWTMTYFVHAEQCILITPFWTSGHGWTYSTFQVFINYVTCLTTHDMFVTCECLGKDRTCMTATHK
jgi:hypothetical protein